MILLSFLIIINIEEKEIYKRFMNSILIQRDNSFVEFIYISKKKKPNLSIECFVQNKLDSNINVRYLMLEESEDLYMKGIEEARGEYFVFLEPTNYLTKDCLEILLWYLKKYNSDLFMYRKNSLKIKEDLPYFSLYNTNEIKNLNLLTNKGLLADKGGLSNKIFKKKFIKKFNILIEEDTAKDWMLINLKVFSFSNTISFIRDPLFINIKNQKEDSHSNVSNPLVTFYNYLNFLNINKCRKNTLFLEFAFKELYLDKLTGLDTNKEKTFYTAYLENSLNNFSYTDIIQLLHSNSINEYLRRFILRKWTGTSDIRREAPLLSIIIPVFNVGSYLHQALLSVVNQSLSPAFLEIIIVDDKSTDNSLEICKSFASRYSYIKVLELPSNTPGGAGIPSNKGLIKAKGEYIGFVDADDFIEFSMFEDLLNEALRTGSDIIMSSFAIYNEKDKKVKDTYDKKAWSDLIREVSRPKPVPMRELKRKILLKLSPVPWRKLYKHSFLKQNNLYFPEGKDLYEDNPFHWYTTIKSQSFSFIDKVLIYHRMGRAGQTMEIVPSKLLSYISHGYNVKSFLTKNGIYKEYRLDFIIWMLQISSWVIPNLASYKTSYINSFRKLIGTVSIKELEQCRKITSQRKATKYFNFFLVHGAYKIAVVVKWIIINRPRVNTFLRLPKKT